MITYMAFTRKITGYFTVKYDIYMGNYTITLKIW